MIVDKIKISSWILEVVNPSEIDKKDVYYTFLQTKAPRAPAKHHFQLCYFYVGKWLSNAQLKIKEAPPGWAGSRIHEPYFLFH